MSCRGALPADCTARLIVIDSALSPRNDVSSDPEQGGRLLARHLKRVADRAVAIAPGRSDPGTLVGVSLVARETTAPAFIPHSCDSKEKSQCAGQCWPRQA